MAPHEPTFPPNIPTSNESLNGQLSGVNVSDEDEVLQSPGNAKSQTLSSSVHNDMQADSYLQRTAKTVGYHILAVCTIGLLYLVTYWKPKWKVTLCCGKAPLASATYLIIRNGDEPEEVCTVEQDPVAADFPLRYRISESTELLCSSNSSLDSGSGHEDDTRSLLPRSARSSSASFWYRHFTFQNVKFVWCPAELRFVELRALDDNTAITALLTQHEGHTDHQRDIMSELYGCNEIPVKIKSYISLLINEVMNPYYMFQVASIALWCADAYYLYASCIFILSCVSVGLSVRQNRQESVRLHSMVMTQQDTTIEVLRRVHEDQQPTPEGTSISSLVPGDVLLLPATGCLLPCDCALITGTAIVNESMLTGESVPVTKTAVCSSDDLSELYDTERHRRHTLFCGTQLIQTRYYGNNQVRAVVVRTGFSTTKGELVRSILFPKPMLFKFYQDSMKFVCVLGGIAMIGMIYTIALYIMRGMSVGSMIVRSLDLVTIVVPPALPAAMTVGTYYAHRRLQRQNIFCISPPRINVAGKIKLVCFDKTGTLTEDGLEVYGVVGVDQQSASCDDNYSMLDVSEISDGKSLVSTAVNNTSESTTEAVTATRDTSSCSNAPGPTEPGTPPKVSNVLWSSARRVSSLSQESQLMVALATCHDLTYVHGKLIGDPMDIKMFQSTKWVLDEPGSSSYESLMLTVVRPPSTALCAPLPVTVSLPLAPKGPLPIDPHPITLVETPRHCAQVDGLHVNCASPPPGPDDRPIVPTIPPGAYCPVHCHPTTNTTSSSSPPLITVSPAASDAPAPPPPHLPNTDAKLDRLSPHVASSGSKDSGLDCTCSSGERSPGADQMNSSETLQCNENVLSAATVSTQSSDSGNNSANTERDDPVAGPSDVCVSMSAVGDHSCRERTPAGGVDGVTMASDDACRQQLSPASENAWQKEQLTHVGPRSKQACSAATAEDPSKDELVAGVSSPAASRILMSPSGEAVSTATASQQVAETKFQIPYEVGVLRVLDFNSTVQRMSVVVRQLTCPSMELYCKGAPEVLLRLSDPATVPSNLLSVLEGYTMQGYRVIALGHRTLPQRITWRAVQKAPREKLEQHLTFIGLLILQNPLKEASLPVVQELRAANIRTVMATGDNVLTGVSMARECGMVRPDELVLLLSVSPPSAGPSSSPALMTATLAKADQHADDLDLCMEDLLQSSSDGQHLRYHLALSGATWRLLHQYFPQYVGAVCCRGTVFGRMSPDSKSELVEELMALDYVVAMCGDGANDCGALKAAHVGISLSEAEASVAAPFTSSRADVSCVPLLIKEGRASLVTNFSVFKYMALYSLIQFLTVLMLYTFHTNLSDPQFLYIDLGIVTSIAIFMGYTRAGKWLVCERPVSSLLGGVTLFSVAVQVVLMGMGQVGAFYYLAAQPWYQPNTSDGGENTGGAGDITWEASVLFYVSSLQYLILALVYSPGAPFRRPFYTNAWLLASLIIFGSLNCVMTLYPGPWTEFLLLESEQPYVLWLFRGTLLMMAALHLVLAFVAEHWITRSMWVKRFFQFARGKRQPKNLHKRVLAALEHDTKFPPTGQPIVAMQL